MKILGIETSCDETAGAVVQDGTKILSNIVASSAEMHIKTGGIIPEEAARQQVKSILPVIQNALDESKLKVQEVDAIAVTAGPGLIGSLLVGVETAKTLSYVFNKPLIPVNHLFAHIYANWLTQDLNNNAQKSPKFPALALVVSGGHTDLVLLKDHGKIKWVGGTRDDAAGEAFDKCARLLGLSYPGGPSISKEAERFSYSQDKPLTLFPRPMIDLRNFDFSFSGLKTAVLRETQKVNKGAEEIAHMAAEVQEAIVDVLVEKSSRSLVKFKPKSFLLAGGVAANKRLKEKFEEKLKYLKTDTKLFIPHPSLCTDNASYIASFAFFNYAPFSWRKVTANPELTIVSSLAGEHASPEKF